MQPTLISQQERECQRGTYSAISRWQLEKLYRSANGIFAFRYSEDERSKAFCEHPIGVIGDNERSWYQKRAVRLLRMPPRSVNRNTKTFMIPIWDEKGLNTAAWNEKRRGSSFAETMLKVQTISKMIASSGEPRRRKNVAEREQVYMRSNYVLGSVSIFD